MKENKYLKAGKYFYVKGHSTVKILKDSLITDITEFENFLAVRIEGEEYGSLLVDNPKNILKKPRTKKILIRNKPCHCVNFNFQSTEWTAGVPIYCKIMFNGSPCPLIKVENNLYSCNYEKSKVTDYKEVCKLNLIELEFININYGEKQ